MNKIRSFGLIFIIIGLSLPYIVAFSEPDDSQDAPAQMTTSEPIVTIQDAVKKCYHETCEDCIKAKCFWLDCETEQYCYEEPRETCNSLTECKNITTSTHPPTTTTVSPNDTTTVSPNDTTTTQETTTVTTGPPTTTTDNSTTTTSTTTTTIATTTENTTTTTTPVTTTPNSTTTSPASTSTTTEAPHQRHFDAGSFVGGMILALTLTAVAFAGWKFYRRRALSTSYTNF